MTVEMLTIDPEFKSLIPPQSAEEHAGLEELIKKDGCRDAIVTWQGIIVDGHNRFEICTRLNIPFNTVEMDFKDRDEVCDWIEKNQLSRRNLTPDQMSLIRGRRYNRLKRQGERNDLTCGQNVHKLTTSESLAKEHGVNEKTIRRDGAAAAAIDTMPKIADAVIKGEIKKSDAIEIVNLSEEAAEEILEIVESGKESVKEAIKTVKIENETIPELKEKLKELPEITKEEAFEVSQMDKLTQKVIAELTPDRIQEEIKKVQDRFEKRSNAKKSRFVDSVEGIEFEPVKPVIFTPAELSFKVLSTVEFLTTLKDVDAIVDNISVYSMPFIKKDIEPAYQFIKKLYERLSK